jgi:hypothetical protein
MQLRLAAVGGDEGEEED